MNRAQLSITVGLLVLLLLINQLSGGNYGCQLCPGGLPWYGWLSGFVVLLIAALAYMRQRGARAHQLLKQPAPAQPAVAPEHDERWNEKLRRKYDWDGPAHPHPVIITERCIGCQACVESCPHDVLTISYTEKHQPVASVVDHELCMEDTSCEAICPVNPKACVVVNTAHKIKSLPAPWRNARYMSSVAGCYIIGDVSGMPLIKNAANEGANVMIHIAQELHDTGGNAPPSVEYDVVIIGAGPAGLSAAVMAKKLNLRYIGIEQDTVMSTIAKYPKNKYVFLKPETMSWASALHLPGLDHYMEEVLEEMLDEPDKTRVAEMLAAERDIARRLEEKIAAANRDGKKYEPCADDKLAPQIANTLAAARARYQQLLEAESLETLDAAARQRLKNARARLEQLLDGEDKYILSQILAEECAGQINETEVGKKDRLNLARRQHGDGLDAAIEAGKLTKHRFDALTAARAKVAGHQREVLLNTWLLHLREHDLRINQQESCKSVQKAEDGDYFIVQTEKLKGEPKLMTYHARRVVLAIGNSSSPTKLRAGGKGADKESNKILYRLSEPMNYVKLDLIVVGGGNSAVEAAVDLVTRRQGDQIIPRTAEQQNKSVTLLVRGSGLKTDVKFGNKQQLYQCIDGGLIKLCFNTEIKKIHDNEVVTTNQVTGKVEIIKPNDFIFALIGSERPAALLTQINVKINK